MVILSPIKYPIALIGDVIKPLQDIVFGIDRVKHVVAAPPPFEIPID
jgi:hypothetical protein